MPPHPMTALPRALMLLALRLLRDAQTTSVQYSQSGTRPNPEPRRILPLSVADDRQKGAERCPATHEVNRRQRWRLHDQSGAQTPPKSERLQISHHPDRPCKEESQAEFGPVQMGFWVSDQARNPNQHSKERQHECHQAYRQPCLTIDENGNRRECKCDRREYRPKSPIYWNPLWNQVGGHTKIEYLTQRK